MSTHVYAPRNAVVYPISPKQVAFIGTLCAERGLDFDPDLVAQFTSTEARREIDRLLAMPKIAAAKAGRLATEVPAGYYATPSAGGNDLDFWRIDKPTEGRWDGYVFVKRVLGGDNRLEPVRGAEAAAAVAAVEAAGWQESAAVFGREIGSCSRCHLDLTDLVSRFTGFGPTCRGHVGVAVTAETRAAAAAWAEANGHVDLLAG